jgi:hypothetical protein
MQHTKSIPAWAFIAPLAAVSFLASPLQVDAQNTCSGSQGQNGVYNATCNNGHPGVVGSSGFVDASQFLRVTQGQDLCDTIYYLFTHSYPASGEVIDARAISGSALTCTKGSPWSEGGNSVSVPSTILLPAGTIVIPSTWVLPANTHLIGEGDGIPGTSFTPGTTIQASGFSSGSSMIQFGPLTCLPQPGVPSFCSGISVEKLTLDGNGQSVNGITNALGIGPSYVDYVSLYRILGTGLSVSGSAINSGPYTNITFNTGSSSATSATVCAQMKTISTMPPESAAKGLWGFVETMTMPRTEPVLSDRIARSSFQTRMPTEGLRPLA